MLKLSIVTVTYNAAKVIDITAQSIAKFKNEYIEWIVIDGMSSDGTVELLKLYSDYIDLLVIEPDEGIFDAMNKQNSEDASSFMKEHLRRTMDIYKKYLSNSY